MDYELRATSIKPELQLRNNKPVISGTAIVFYDGSAGSEYRLDPQREIYERITREAVERALERQPDLLACLDHDENQPLGRTPKTLKLRVDQKGLHYETRNQRTTHYKNAVNMIKDDIIRGSSFRFVPTRTTWIRDGNKDIRQVDDMELAHISPVKFPAYKNSKALVRSIEQLDKERAEDLARLAKTERIWAELT